MQSEVSDLETDREAVEPCHFEPEVHYAMQVLSQWSEHGLKMASVETNKYSTI